MFDCFRFGNVILFSFFLVVNRYQQANRKKAGAEVQMQMVIDFGMCLLSRLFTRIFIVFLCHLAKVISRILTLRFDSTKNERREIETAAYLIQQTTQFNLFPIWWAANQNQIDSGKRKLYTKNPFRDHKISAILIIDKKSTILISI